MGFSSARNLGRDISAGFSPPRRMPISEAVKKFMRVPKGAGNSVPWDPELTPYIIEPLNCLASREYDAVIFVGPARTGKTIGLIDGWIVYTIVCDPSDMLVVQMTEDKAREHSKKRLDRTFRSSAAVLVLYGSAHRQGLQILPGLIHLVILTIFTLQSEIMRLV